jgi:hypothetical protein
MTSPSTVPHRLPTLSPSTWSAGPVVVVAAVVVVVVSTGAAVVDSLAAPESEVSDTSEVGSGSSSAAEVHDAASMQRSAA